MVIKDFITISRETNFLDFKLKITFKNDKVEFIRDIIAFANNDYVKDKYIVYGIKEDNDKPVVIGLKDLDFVDPADYQNLLSEKVEPHIEIDFATQDKGRK